MTTTDRLALNEILVGWGLAVAPGTEPTPLPSLGSVRDAHMAPLAMECVGIDGSVGDAKPTVRCVLKRHVRDRKRLAYQTTWQRRFAAAGVPVATLLPPLAATSDAFLEDARGGLWTLTRWAEGTQVKRADASLAAHRAIGALAAQLNNVVAGCAAAAQGEHVHTYQTREAVLRGLDPALVKIADADAAAVLSRERDACAAALAALEAGGSVPRAALVHNDLHFDNVVFCADDAAMLRADSADAGAEAGSAATPVASMPRVVALLDFDIAHGDDLRVNEFNNMAWAFGCTISDPDVAGFTAGIAMATDLRRVDALMDGYDAVAVQPLSADERRAVLQVLRARGIEMAVRLWERAADGDREAEVRERYAAVGRVAVDAVAAFSAAIASRSGTSP